MRTYAELVKEAIRAAYEKSENEYKKFEVGRTYATRSVCNSECIFKITIIKRTEKIYYHSRKIEEFQEVKNDERKKRKI